MDIGYVVVVGTTIIAEFLIQDRVIVIAVSLFIKIAVVRIGVRLRIVGNESGAAGIAVRIVVSGDVEFVERPVSA